MPKLVDPFDVIARRKEQAASKASEERASKQAVVKLTAGARQDDIAYEISLDPPPGAKLMQVTCGSTYRDPIPVQYDMTTRTVYPIRKSA